MTINRANKPDNTISIQKISIPDLLSAAILEAPAAVIGDEEPEKLLQFRNNRYQEVFSCYVTHYLDKCNIEYLKTNPRQLFL